jgi:hypothetical protein
MAFVSLSKRDCSLLSNSSFDSRIVESLTLLDLNLFIGLFMFFFSSVWTLLSLTIVYLSFSGS